TMRIGKYILGSKPELTFSPSEIKIVRPINNIIKKDAINTPRMTYKDVVVPPDLNDWRNTKSLSFILKNNKRSPVLGEYASV
ncbi:MAG: hypothetical protein PHV06_08255, partial [bacterium]|nr:hypothetical protein [bacterium]